jgi:hypothetical protein
MDTDCYDSVSKALCNYDEDKKWWAPFYVSTAVKFHHFGPELNDRYDVQHTGIQLAVA